VKLEKQEPELICKYCDSQLRPIEPFIIVEADSETAAITRTHVCEVCGASVIDRKSPASGDCLLEIPREYQHALTIFSQRVDLLADFDDYELLVFGECSLSQSAEFQEILNHGKHGDGFNISVCTCCSVKIYFDGHAVITIHEEPETSWDSDPIRHVTEQNQAFEDLRHKLDELLFDSAQLKAVQDTIVECLATRSHPDFCSRGERFDRLECWGMAGSLEYPDRFKAFSKSPLQE
jgi:hypothetical protein